MIHTKERRTVREVVDGQQRISAILDFIGGKFTLLPSHNKDLSRTTYVNLPEYVQQAILSYPLSVNIINTSDDAVLLEIFSRLNAYSVPLNRPEKLNAKYTGSFKQTVHDIARRHLAFWTRAKILSNQAIARMGDVDIVSDLVVTMLDGLQNQKTKVDLFYKKYDEDFPYAEEVASRFQDTLDMIEQCVGVGLGETEYRRPALFYSLFSGVYERAYGFGDPPLPRTRTLAGDLATVRDRLQELSDIVRSAEPPPNYVAFVGATLRSTDKLPQRRTRHSVIASILEPAFE